MCIEKFDPTTVLLQKTIDDFTCHLVGCQRDFLYYLGEVLCREEHLLEDACHLEGGHLVAFLKEVHQAKGHLGAFLGEAYHLACLDVASSSD